VQEKRLVLIERGDAELWLPEADGERFVGLIGPTKAPEAREKWCGFHREIPKRWMVYHGKSENPNG